MVFYDKVKIDPLRGLRTVTLFTGESNDGHISNVKQDGVLIVSDNNGIQIGSMIVAVDPDKYLGWVRHNGQMKFLVADSVEFESLMGTWQVLNGVLKYALPVPLKVFPHERVRAVFDFSPYSAIPIGGVLGQMPSDFLLMMNLEAVRRM